MTNKFPEMPFWDHLEELRWRLITSIVVILIGAGITYKFSDTIMHWLIIPTESLDIDLNLQVLKITSMFTVKLMVALFGGITLGLPVLLYQFWRFVSPAFEDSHGLAVLITVLFSSAFFVLGMCFSYFVIIPFSLAFFTSLASESVDVAYNFTLEGYLIYILWLVSETYIFLDSFILRVAFISPIGIKRIEKILVYSLCTPSTLENKEANLVNKESIYLFPTSFCWH